MRRHRWEYHDKGRALTLAGTLSADDPAMQLDKVLRDRQTQSESKRSAGRRRILLAKPIEHVRQKRRSNALPVILHGDSQSVSGCQQVKLDPARLLRELDSIVHEIPQHLLQPSGIADDFGPFGFTPPPPGRRSQDIPTAAPA